MHSAGFSLIGPKGQVPDTPRTLGWLGRTVFLVLSLSVVSTLALPWTQTVGGEGRVVAYSPMEREQRMHAPVPGRIERWWVVEGSRVKAGDPIVEIQDLDPEYTSRLDRRREAEADRLAASERQAAGLTEQAGAYGKARDLKVKAADLKVKMAEQKLAGAKQKLAAFEGELETARINFERTEQLLAKGLVSTRQWELAKLETVKAEANVNLALTQVSEAEAGRTALEADSLRAHAEGMADVLKAHVDAQKAQAEAAYAKTDLAKAEVDVARQASRIVRAPLSGVIVRIDGGEGGRILKGGEELAVLVPDTESRAVELYIDGNDGPLVAEGRKVRVQFEGWPAFQFSGWPGTAIGTFGGVVSFVHPAATDDEGRIRVLITADPSEPPWPAAVHLRQQVRALGWILLDEVRLGWEVWRRINGFPQSVGGPPDRGGLGRKKAAPGPDGKEK